MSTPFRAERTLGQRVAKSSHASSRQASSATGVDRSKRCPLAKDPSDGAALRCCAAHCAARSNAITHTHPIPIYVSNGLWSPTCFSLSRFLRIDAARENDRFVCADARFFQRVLRVFLLDFEVRFLGTAIMVFVVVLLKALGALAKGFNATKAEARALEWHTLTCATGLLPRRTGHGNHFCVTSRCRSDGEVAVNLTRLAGNSPVVGPFEHILPPKPANRRAI
jgi:hypothetical protein